MKIIIMLLISAVSFNLYSKRIAGVDIPRTFEYAEGKTLHLKGAGFQKKLWINIYGCALYLEDTSADRISIVNDDRPMAFRMHITYGKMKRKQLIKGLRDGFQYSTKKNEIILKALKPRIEKFLSFFDKEPQKYDTATFLYIPGEGTHVNLKGEYRGLIPGLAFKKYLFNIWLGNHKATQRIQKGILN